MTEVYFDIVPHSTGWLCLVNGRQTARFTSFHQAESAGRRFADEPGTDRTVVVRRQDPCGTLRPMNREAEGYFAD